MGEFIRDVHRHGLGVVEPERSLGQRCEAGIDAGAHCRQGVRSAHSLAGDHHREKQGLAIGMKLGAQAHDVPAEAKTSEHLLGAGERCLTFRQLQHRPVAVGDQLVHAVE